ncbi:MAG: 16S rRNA (guanine(966)-N(2))-methyltransferase RsmD [Lachnospiraceae bacterium]|nr:16S rRNA (guanine(966)-N(2))-methyltransferase RsmD [Lachnospiraceae bacterium]
MRVIAGKKRHLVLRAVKGDAVRPTTDRTKETLFNVLNPNLVQCSFLDLFSGTGAIGIEALSRGAEYVVFVENAKESLECIKDNLKTTGLTEEARIVARDAISALGILETEKRSFDIIFMDPPYNKELEKQVLNRLSGSSLVTEDTIIVVEASKETEFSYLSELGFECYKEKGYLNNKHVFIRPKGTE